MTKEEKRQKLLKLREKMLKDNSLPLKKGANKLVFGAGNVQTDILFIGEGPGYWEDQKGIPFVGNAGKLLDQLLLMNKLDRKKVFITNVVHHRPPDNRDPEPSEITAYKLYLDEIIKIIDPKVIVTLGRFSMAKFMPGVFISSVHGREREISVNGKKVWVIPMYHPAAALRNGDVKAKLTEDFKKIPDLASHEMVKVEVEEKEDMEDNRIQQTQLI